MTTAERVMEYAKKHHMDAPIWFDIMECYELSEMEEDLKSFGITTLSGAKRHFMKVNDVIEDRMADARNSRF